MEILKRPIKSIEITRTDEKSIFRIDLIDNRRIGLRWVLNKSELLVNLTESETRKLRECLK